ncbi:MAG: hypothetical protein ABIJ86_04290 [Spirochaetota bacterium]
MPVGRIEFAYMHPMSFSEFLWAKGEEALADFLRAYTLGTTINPVIHEKLLRLVRMYFFIGGIPEAVRDYATSAEMVSIERIHESTRG